MSWIPAQVVEQVRAEDRLAGDDAQILGDRSAVDVRGRGQDHWLHLFACGIELSMADHLGRRRAPLQARAGLASVCLSQGAATPICIDPSI